MEIDSHPQNVMFSVIDAAAETVNRPKTTADRACDQCKVRKIRCDMKRPCLVCQGKGFTCTYERARKKRGPVGKRIKEIMELQAKTGASGSNNGQQQALASDSTIRTQLDVSNDQQQGINGGSLDMELHTPTSSHSATELDATPQSPYWPTAHHSLSSPTPDGAMPPLQRAPTSATIFSEASMFDPALHSRDSNASEYTFPSLPIETPPSTWDPFGAMLQQDLPPLPTTLDIWPSHINESTLLPWIDVYFKRLHPTIPILSRTTLYREMLLRKQHTDQQFGAMLLALCAFAMTQPVQIHERASAPSRTAQARMLMEACVRMRVAADFGETASIEMVLASFFLFACLFGNNQHKAARLRLREAVDLAHSLGVHLPESYNGLDVETRAQWLRTYLVLSVTERAYALQQRHSIDFRGRPGITARFMQAFDQSDATAFISSLIFQDQADAVGMTGLLYLMDAFDAFDGSVIECWLGYCNYSDGACDSFDRRRALQMFRAQYKAREACMDGNISFAPSASPMPLSKLLETQRADIAITQLWLLNRLWNLCLSHGLVREQSEHPELEFMFACRIARAMVDACRALSLASMEVHGVGFVEKIFHAAMDVVAAVKASRSAGLDLTIPSLDERFVPAELGDDEPMTIRMLMLGLNELLHDFRGGDHAYSAPFTSALHEIFQDAG